MKKLILCACLTALATCRVLTAYAEHQHTYSEANCKNAAVCSECGETIQEALGHTSSVGVCLRCGNVQNEDLVNTLNTCFAEIMDIGNNLISCVSCIADLDDDTQYNKFQIADGYVSDMKNLYSSIIASCKNISELDNLVYQITLLQNSCPDAIQGNDATSLANQTFLYQLYLQQISSSFNYFSEYMDYLAGNRDLPEGTQYFEEVKTMPTPDSIISGITFDSAKTDSGVKQYMYLIGDNEDDANLNYNIYLSAVELADDLKVEITDSFSYVEKDESMVSVMMAGTDALKGYFLIVSFQE